MKQEHFMNWIVIALMLTTLTSTILIVTFLPQLRVIYNDGIYKMEASNNQDQTIIESIANVCNLHEDNISRIQCVYGITSQTDVYNYEIKDFVYADDLVESAGDCKSWTIFYMAIYDRMGFNTKPITIDNHVYLNVETKTSGGDQYYCNVDQLQLDCYELTEGPDTEEIELAET